MHSNCSCTVLGQKVATGPILVGDTSSYWVNFVAVSWSIQSTTIYDRCHIPRVVKAELQQAACRVHHLYLHTSPVHLRWMHPTHSTLHITRDHTNLQSSPALPTGANIVRRDEACKERRRVVVVLKNMVITEGNDTIHACVCCSQILRSLNGFNSLTRIHL